MYKQPSYSGLTGQHKPRGWEVRIFAKFRLLEIEIINAKVENSKKLQTAWKFSNVYQYL